MYTFKLNYGVFCGIFLSLMLFSKSSFSQSFIPPDEVTQFGHTYKLAFKNIVPDKTSTYEYTTNNESIEKWTSLITFAFTKSKEDSHKKLANALNKSLIETKPVPYFDIYERSNHLYVRIIFFPIPNDQNYESGIQKFFFLKNCGGFLNYQYAIKYPEGSDHSNIGQQVTYNSIKYENEKMENEMETVDWSSTCH